MGGEAGNILAYPASRVVGGVLFSSNPHCHNEEGWDRGRYCVYHNLETWRRIVSAAGAAI